MIVQVHNIHLVKQILDYNEITELYMLDNTWTCIIIIKKKKNETYSHSNFSPNQAIIECDLKRCKIKTSTIQKQAIIEGKYWQYEVCIYNSNVYIF